MHTGILSGCRTYVKNFKSYACNVHGVPNYVNIDKVKELNNIFVNNA